ncbi:M14 family zinc carboxypeptidase [Virgibacillus kimchii]
MMQSQIRNRIVFMTILLVFILFSSTSIAAMDDNEHDLPTTGFEDRNSGEWTTLDEEIDFINEVADLSDRVWYEEVGQSVEGKPIYLVYVGESERSKDEIQNGRTVFILGTPHGNEPAGREGAFKIMRDLAFTDDPDMLDTLEESTVLIMPTPNPDGREANTRRNSWGIDNNRDNLSLITPENQIIASVLRDYSPDITIDAHERPSGSNPDIEYLWPRNLNVDREIYDLNVELVQDYMMPDAIEDGWSTGLYGRPGGSGREDERILRNMGGLRHGISVLTESAGTAPNEDRVDMQLSSYYSVLRFYQERFDEIAIAVDGAPTRKQEDGRNKAPFYLAGADDEPEKEQVIDPPVCGYLLHTKQAEAIERHIDLFELEVEQVSDNGVFITMDQPMMTVIPFLVDDRALYNEVEGLPLEDCTDPGSMDPPEPPEETAPAQYQTDFSNNESGIPSDWTMQWRDSNWEIKGDPHRLEHYVDSEGGRRLLAWDTVGEVHGDVEVSALVRPRGSGATLFQLQLHTSGEAGSENSYYLDVRTSNDVRINRNLDGSFSTRATSSLPFIVNENTWLNVVLKREGSMLKGKVWPYGADEPEDWSITVEDPLTNSGQIGLGHVTSNRYNDWAFVGVGTGGEDAPRAPENMPGYISTAGLEDLVDSIEGENLVEDDYTQETWALLENAMENARNVLQNAVNNPDEAVQSVINDALVELENARSGLLSKHAAQYETDFSEYELDQSPSDWSTLWRDSNWKITDNPRRLEHSLDSGGRRALTWDAVGEHEGDTEVSAVVRASNVGDTMFQVGFHMSGEAGSENAYYIDMRSPDASSRAKQLRIGKYVNGSYTLIGGSGALPFEVGEDIWYEVVLKIEGDRLYAKAWPYGEEEPDDFQVIGQDSSFSSGKLGLAAFTNGTINDWAFVGVGAGGLDAPRAPGDLFEPEEPEVDKTALQERVDEIHAENLNEEDYTADSWQALQEALTAAEEVLNDPDATQEAVDISLTVLNEARVGLEETETEPISAADMIGSIEQFDEAGAFEDDQVVRSLTLHLTAVEQYESQEEAEKVVRHMENFLLLLDHMEEQMIEEAYESLYAAAESLIDRWG